MAARLRRRRRSRSRLRLAQSPLRLHRRGQQPAPRGVVPRWRDAAERDARRARAGSADLCACGGWARKTARCGTCGTSPRNPDVAAMRSAQVAAGSRRGHRGRRRHYARDRLAAGRQAHRADRHRRARPAQEAHHRRAHGCVSAHVHGRSITATIPTKLRISFDDGPDPKWTPQHSRHPRTEERERHVPDHRRRSPGEHRPAASASCAKATRSATTPTRIPTSAKSRRNRLDLEVKLTERLFASKLGVQPLYFRPPYDIDEEPDTDDQAAPDRAHPAGRATSSSATRSTPTTGTSASTKTPAGDYAVGARAAATA